MKGLTASGLKVMRIAFYTMDKIGFLWGDQTGDPGKALLNFSHCNRLAKTDKCTLLAGGPPGDTYQACHLSWLGFNFMVDGFAFTLQFL